MTLRRISPAASQALREAVEKDVEKAVAGAVRAVLADVLQASLAAVDEGQGVTASSAPVPDPIPGPLSAGFPTLGEHAGRWAAEVDDRVTAVVTASFTRVYESYSTQGLAMSSSALAGLEEFALSARDRLVRGTHFGVPVYEESYNAVRIALARSIEEGWTRQDLSQRIAASLSWETDGAYWRGQQALVDSKIDAILDPLGPPGTPAREFARKNDPRVAALRQERNLAIKHLDAERSVWERRSTLIARTESTGASNLGAQRALLDEGTEKKVWVATLDDRTRPTHEDADGQEVPVGGEFDVGGALLAFPGDPAGPVEEVADCRCTMIGGDYV